jgi:hypothetical protein
MNAFGADELEDLTPESELVSAALALDSAKKLCADAQIGELDAQRRLKDAQALKIKSAADLKVALERMRALALNISVPAVPQNEIAKPTTPVAQVPVGDTNCTFPGNQFCKCSMCAVRFGMTLPVAVAQASAPPEAQVGKVAEVRDARIPTEADKAVLADFMASLKEPKRRGEE